MWGLPERLVAPPCPMPTSTVRQLYSRIYSLPRWPAFVNNKGRVPARTSSASRIDAQPGLDHHLALLNDVPISQVPPCQRRRQGPPPAGSWRLPAGLRATHRSQTQATTLQTGDLHPNSLPQFLQHACVHQTALQFCPVLDSSEMV